MNPTRILIVDDDPKLSELVRIYLERTHRFQVRIENRSAHALESARDFRPEAILLDVDMPGKDGGQVAREIRADGGLRSTPILFLTSLISRSEAGDHEITRGGERYLAKPVSPKALVDVVDRVLAA